jgi:hypothetical protein
MDDNPKPKEPPLTDSKENLLEFIQKESLVSTPQSNKTIIETYACALWKGFFDMKHKMQPLKDLNCIKAVDMGLLLIDNVFWIIYNYSSNIQLTLFLTERGRLLYTEFLHMSRTHQLMKELNTFPSIHDGFQFAIKKSIGALTCKEHTQNSMFREISTYRMVYRNMFQVLNMKYLCNDADEKWTDDDVNITLNILNHSMSEAVHRDYGLFEYCITHLLIESFTLTTYLLMFQLTTDISNTHFKKQSTPLSKMAYERVVCQIYNFIQENHTLIDHTLDCLQEEHMLQHKWSIRQKQIMQQLS